MRKNKTKIRHFFTLDPDVDIELQNYLDENIIDKSKLLEKLIIKYLNDSKNNDKK